MTLLEAALNSHNGVHLWTACAEVLRPLNLAARAVSGPGGIELLDKHLDKVWIALSKGHSVSRSGKDRTTIHIRTSLIAPDMTGEKNHAR